MFLCDRKLPTSAFSNLLFYLVFDFSGVSYEEGEERPPFLPPLQPGRGQEQHPGRDYWTSSVVDSYPDPDWGPWIRTQESNNDPQN